MQADPTNIVSVRRGCCRWCWGENNEYQRTDWELDRDLNRFIASSKNKGLTFNQMGGGGYIKTKDPNPDCPICAGEGDTYVSIEDFRKLSSRDKQLIAGIKMTKDGNKVEEIKFHSKIDAINTFAKLEGMIIEKKVVRVLDATEEDLNEYFSNVTIDHDDPELAAFIESAQDEAGEAQESQDEGLPPAYKSKPGESRLERLRRLRDAGELE